MIDYKKTTSQDVKDMIANAYAVNQSIEFYQDAKSHLLRQRAAIETPKNHSQTSEIDRAVSHLNQEIASIKSDSKSSWIEWLIKPVITEIFKKFIPWVLLVIILLLLGFALNRGYFHANENLKPQTQTVKT